MSSVLDELSAGQTVSHSEMGNGVFLSAVAGGYARVFFQQLGERQVAITSLVPALSWEEEVVSNVRPATREAVERLWLALEAEQIPLLENAATLTSAKVDLLPHQIVLTYRIANASPRRFLIADSVGLGKTIAGAGFAWRAVAGVNGCARRSGRKLASRAERHLSPRFRGVRQRRRRDRPQDQRLCQA
ncbi:MAG TPA: hypothetical protein PK867_17660 [Pirellulales bacterium]|nr:hypothetical protein [Pirellulales bacterium]